VFIAQRPLVLIRDRLKQVEAPTAWQTSARSCEETAPREPDAVWPRLSVSSAFPSMRGVIGLAAVAAFGAADRPC